MNKEQIQSAANKLFKNLLSERNSKGVWDGHLSSSALANAVAVFSLYTYNAHNNSNYILVGLQWLKQNINTDGGFGDTPISKSNLSTSLLCWCAFSIVKNDNAFTDYINQLETYLNKQIGSLNPKKISNAILKHYAEDRTFSVPILAMCALAGRLGDNGWKYVPQLPYQFATLPNQFFKWLNLSVVSYALPALISMGLIRHKKLKSKNLLIRFINNKLEPKLLKVLAEKQPSNGGFLEAIPLTGFVLMTMVGAGYKETDICKKATHFLQNSVRKDGSWPIDTNLTTWVSTLAINAMSKAQLTEIPKHELEQISNWLLTQQHKTVHPFTKTAAGGWAWIDTEGGVADGDDTSGALIALRRLKGNNKSAIKSAQMGLNWLMGIQNNDGGFPTFCKGWGKLPFDASCPDITAHAIRAIIEWKDSMQPNFAHKLESSLNKACNFLKKTQRHDGSWLPLWFGNEHDIDHHNPVYGTALVVSGLSFAKNKGIKNLEQIISDGVNFLETCKNKDGSWGGNKGINGSIEETALALKALSHANYQNITENSINWLIGNLNSEPIDSKPIGLYFASLWYYENMYPKVFTLAALNEITDL